MTYAPTDIYRDEADYEEYLGKKWSPYLILAIICAFLVIYYFVKGRL